MKFFTILKKNYILHVHVNLITGTFKFLCLAVISEIYLLSRLALNMCDCDFLFKDNKLFSLMLLFDLNNISYKITSK